jgi:hypothetical protein
MRYMMAEQTVENRTLTRSGAERAEPRSANSAPFNASQHSADARPADIEGLGDLPSTEAFVS